MPARELTAGDAPDDRRLRAMPPTAHAVRRRVPPVTSASDSAAASEFEREFEAVFNVELTRLQRVVTRLGGDAELAADVVQDAFIRLYRRGALPDAPRQWLITVVLNLYRNAVATHSRRSRLLRIADAESDDAGAEPGAERTLEAAESQSLVRTALSRIPERDCRLLMLMAEGYSYREIAGALDLNESSVGTLLMRAKALFRASYGVRDDAR